MIQSDKRTRASLFRDRLLAALQDSGTSRAALARAIGVTRSTISQILDDTEPRLPGGQIVGDCAGHLGVSADWLLGLSDRPERGEALVAASAAVTPAQRALIDEQILAWHQEAAGYKIRHVPATLPDMLKTDAVLTWEYAQHFGRSAAEAITVASDRLEVMRAGQSDFEIALPLHELGSFARAEGYYAGLSTALRHAQIDRIATLHEQYFPSLRLCLFDARQVYSAPLTVFGPLMAVLYLGSHHIVFRDRDRLRALTGHFDGLVRQATVTERDLPGHLDDLRAQIA